MKTAALCVPAASPDAARDDLDPLHGLAAPSPLGVTIATDKICPSCGKRARFFSSKDTLGWVCSACPWSSISHNYAHPIFDRTLYTVWPETRGKDPRWLTVQLATVLGISSREMRKLVDKGGPIAVDVPGGIVCHLHGRLLEAGVGIRVEPAFLWPLEQPRN